MVVVVVKNQCGRKTYILGVQNQTSHINIDLIALYRNGTFEAILVLIIISVF